MMPRYSAKQQKMRGRSGKRQFLMLFRNVKRSAAYHGLSVYGRAALIADDAGQRPGAGLGGGAARNQKADGKEKQKERVRLHEPRGSHGFS